LLKHDWAHRWESILSTIGLEPTPLLHARQARLAEVAAALTTTAFA
jgi:hypothetical protein